MSAILRSENAFICVSCHGCRACLWGPGDLNPCSTWVGSGHISREVAIVW